jgi:ABC-2 type transport system ATP-binding protein
VTQRFTLYGDLSALENLRLQAGLYGLRGERARARLDWALDHLELRARKDALAQRLPLGYQRRLAIAAALLHEPDALFLDEPTSGIDPLARQQFWELVYRLAEGGIGVLVTTHYMDEALFCDRLALMDAGRVVLEGTPGDLLARPLDTPLVELDTPRCAECARWIAEWSEVREVVPYAGRLRLRVRAGVAVDALIAKARGEAERRGIEIEALRRVAPMLEDVFIAALETTQGAA